MGIEAGVAAIGEELLGAGAGDVAASGGELLSGLDLGGSGSVAGMTTAEQLGAIPATEGINAVIDPITGAVSNAGDLSGMSAAARTAAASSGSLGLTDLLGYAKTGGQLIGGLGQLVGGASLIGKSGQLQQQADPFAPYRSGYAEQLSNLMRDPNTVTQTPGYQFNLAQGLQAQQAKQAQQGRLVSGGALLESQAFGQQLAGQSYQDQLKTLAGLSGATQSPAYGTQATIGAMNATGGGWSGVLQGAGNVLDPLATLYTKYNQSTPTA